MPSATDLLNESERKYLSTRLAAFRLGYSPRTLERWRWLGGGPPYTRRKGGRCRYNVSELDAWMREGRVAEDRSESNA